MGERFYLPAGPARGLAILRGEEARHLAKVLRARVGDEATLFDGQGREWPARVTALGRDEVALEVGQVRVEVAAAARRLTIAAALPKGERQKWMVEKLTELGVQAVVPLETARGVAEATASARARLERVVVEACKQCGRNTLMAIAEPRSPAALLAALPAGTRVLVAHPGAGALAPSAGGSVSGDVVALVGPEGGFTDGELAAAAAAGAERIGLGPHVLRVETAALAVAARFAG